MAAKGIFEAAAEIKEKYLLVLKPRPIAQHYYIALVL